MAQGFYAVVDEYWLQSFSPPEVQRLISGDDVDLGTAAAIGRGAAPETAGPSRARGADGRRGARVAQTSRT